MKISKAGDLKREVTLSIIMSGQRVELDGRALSARQIEELDRLYPTPTVPRYQTAEGVWKQDDTNPEYREELEKALMQRMNARAAAVLGEAFFGTSSLPEQVSTLLDTFTNDQITEIVRQARTSSLVERRDVDAEKAAMVPFAATKREAVTSP